MGCFRDYQRIQPSRERAIGSRRTAGAEPLSSVMIAQMLPVRQLLLAHWTGLPPKCQSRRVPDRTRQVPRRGDSGAESSASRRSARANSCISTRCQVCGVPSNSPTLLRHRAALSRHPVRPVAFYLCELYQASRDVPLRLLARQRGNPLARAGTSRPPALPRWHRPTDTPR
jgi:hypothetical protein